MLFKEEKKGGAIPTFYNKNYAVYFNVTSDYFTSSKSTSVTSESPLWF